MTMRPEQNASAQKNSNVSWQESRVTKADFCLRNGHRPMVIWLTGLSGSGKSTVARKVEELLFWKGWQTCLLDGDNIRHGLNSDLGFSEEDRRENIRRIGEVAKLFVDTGVVVLAAFISPYREDRNRVRALFEEGEFHEVFLKCDLTVCEQRDPKGLYRKARAGQIPHFTGIDSPYQEPLNPELVIDTASLDIETTVEAVLKLVEDRSAAPRED